MALAPVPAGDIVPEQQIAGVVSRHFASLSERSETEAWHLVLSALVSELAEADLLSFHTGNVTESRRLNIPRTAYYWYGGFVAKRVAMMLGCYHVYLWNDMMHPESDVVFIGDARNVVACWFICQQMCRLLKTVRLSWRKLQGPWGSRAELDEESHQYAKRLAYSVLDNSIFIGGDEQRSWLGISIACRSLPDHGHSARASIILSSVLTAWAVFIRFAYFLFKIPVSGHTYPAFCPRSHRLRSILCSLSATNSVACLPACAPVNRSRLPHRMHLYGSVRRNAFISAAKPGCSGFFLSSISRAS